MRQHASLAHIWRLRVQGQANMELLELCAAPAWAALLHLLTVTERELAIDNAYACVAIPLTCPCQTCGPGVLRAGALKETIECAVARLPCKCTVLRSELRLSHHLRTARRLWPPAASQLRPAPIDRLTADVAARLVAADLSVLRTGFEDDSADDDEGVAHACRQEFLRPSDAVFPPAGAGAFASAAQRDTVLRVCRRLGVPLVEPPTHIEEVCLCRFAPSGL